MNEAAQQPLLLHFCLADPAVSTFEAGIGLDPSACAVCGDARLGAVLAPITYWFHDFSRSQLQIFSISPCRILRISSSALICKSMLLLFHLCRRHTSQNSRLSAVPSRLIGRAWTSLSLCIFKLCVACGAYLEVWEPPLEFKLSACWTRRVRVKNL